MNLDPAERHAVLIVDDEEQVRRVLERYLENEGYHCTTAADGQTALDLLGREHFSVVVLDIMMPGMSGIEVLRQALARDGDLAVIVVSAVDDRLTAYRSLELGAFGYIVKPFEKNEILIGVSNALLRRRLTMENRRYRTSLENIMADRTAELMHTNILLQHRIAEKEALADSLQASLADSERLATSIARNQQELEAALNEVSGLIARAAANKDFSVRFVNPALPECYTIMQCDKRDCLCYGKGALRCWQIAGTLCGGETQGDFAKKYQSCLICPAYRQTVAELSVRIGEEFNNMMHILEQKNLKLLNAFETLQKTQRQVVHQEKMASIGQLSAGIAHEINNPVGYVATNLVTLGKYAERLMEFIGELNAWAKAAHKEELHVLQDRLKIDRILADLPALINECAEGCDRIKSIVMDLKSFARADADRPEPADINATIDKALNIVWNELKYKATVQKEYGELPRTFCLPGQLGQVFMNLLVNAAQAIEKQGTITIRTWQEDNAILVSVGDSGCGIKPENLAQIFSPFFTTKEIGKGTGLGLSIAREIMERHQGGIRAESLPGRGATFTVWLPLKETV